MHFQVNLYSTGIRLRELMVERKLDGGGEGEERN